MTPAEFARRLAASGLSGRACDAARLVLVDGVGRYEAAKRIGINYSAVHRTTERIENLVICPECGQEVK